MSLKWDIERSDGSLVLSRGGRNRFDIAATVDFPTCGRARLAHQVRQDVWRALRNVRGLSPIVSIESVESGLRVSAGGEIQGQTVAKVRLEERILKVLQDPTKRARWFKHAAISQVENA